jgi:hypothetical protein
MDLFISYSLTFLLFSALHQQAYHGPNFHQNDLTLTGLDVPYTTPRQLPEIDINASKRPALRNPRRRCFNSGQVALSPLSMALQSDENVADVGNTTQHPHS